MIRWNILIKNIFVWFLCFLPSLIPGQDNLTKNFRTPRPSLGSELPAPLGQKIPDSFDSPAPAIPGNPNPGAPVLTASFEGISYNGSGSFPPDPTVAAGPSHILITVNRNIEWFTKQGVKQSSKTLNSFFTPFTPLLYNGFDPRCLYDQFNGRFIVMCLGLAGRSDTIASNDSSLIYVAVSDDADPNGTWYFSSINSKFSSAGKKYWADFPSLGISHEALYITANLFTFSTGTFGGSRFWIINKDPFYNNGTAVFSVLSFGYPRFATHLFGISSDGISQFIIDNPSGSGYLYVETVQNPLTTPVVVSHLIFFDGFSSSGDLIAPQPDTSIGLETDCVANYTSAVWRDNFLWLTFSVKPFGGSNSDQATVYWLKVNTNTWTVMDQGLVDGEDIAVSTHTYYPGIGVDKFGNMGLEFSASGPTVYAGIYYTGRLSNDPAGTVRPAGVLRQGEDLYIRVYNNRNRWGDYSGMALDPVDETTFWIYNEYAKIRGTPGPYGDGVWGSAIGSFSLISADSNQAPVLSPVGNKTVNENQLLTFTLTAGDPNNDPLNYSALNLPSGSTLINAVFNWTPDYDDSGSYALTFIVSDGLLADSENVTIFVNNVNRPPAIDPIPDSAAKEGDTLALIISASDPDLTPLSISARDLPGGSTLTDSIFRWDVAFNQAGFFKIIFIASDGALAESDTVLFTINNTNRLPQFLSGYDLRPLAYEDSLYTDTVQAIDLDSLDYVRYSLLAPVPLSMSIDSVRGILTFLPVNQQVGIQGMIIQARDQFGAAAVLSETLTVINVNDAPRIESLWVSQDTIQEGDSVRLRVWASDMDGDSIRWIWQNRDILGTSDSLIYKTNFQSAGPESIWIQVADGNGGADQRRVVIKINNVSLPPEIINSFNSIIRKDSLLIYGWRASPRDPDLDTTALYFHIAVSMDSHFTTQSALGDSIRGESIFFRELRGLDTLQAGAIYVRVRAFDQRGYFTGWGKFSRLIYEPNPLLTGRFTDVMPRAFDLIGNQPNPFNPQTEIVIAVSPAPGANRSAGTRDVLLTVLNLKGQIVKILIQDRLRAGYHRIIFDGKDRNGEPLTSGPYLIRMNAAGFVKTKKVLLLK